MSEPTNIALPEAARGVLFAIAEAIARDGDVLARQVRVARAVAVSPTYVEIDIPPGCALGSWPDGPLSPSPTLVDSAGQAVGSVLAWVSGGKLTLLEQTWYTDDPPFEWPPVDRLVFA